MVTTRNKFTEFFDTHRVFNTDEFQKHCAVTGYHARNILVRYTQSRHIRKLRNKLYTVLPEGSPDSFMPSPLLVAGKSAEDAVLSYSSALTYYGMARNLIFTYPYLSQKRAHQYQLGNDCFQPCMPSKELKDAYHFGVTTQILWNTPIQVVCKERLLVDLLDRLSLSGGWEEIADAFQYENTLNWLKLIKYLELLKSPATAGRVGFFLDRFQTTMDVPDEVLLKLEGWKPGYPEYFYRNYRKGYLDKRWNLYITDEMRKNTESEYVF